MNLTSPPLLALYAAYALVLVLWANVIFATRLPWVAKLVSTALAGGLFFFTWQTLPQLAGWPTRGATPERFNLAALEVQEPDKSGANKGVIYLWVTRLATNTSEVVPRAFELPYSGELQLKLTAASTKLRKRMPQLGETVPGKAPASGHGPASVDLNFYDMPDPLFPER